MATIQQQWLKTYDDLMALPEDGTLHELVRGEILHMPPPKIRHGHVEAALIGAIDRYLYSKAVALGWAERQGLRARDALVGYLAGGEAGVRFSLPDDPDQVRGLDLLYLSVEQVERQGELLNTGYVSELPVLVAEVISPSERAAYVEEKLNDFLAGGAQLVWLLYPEQRSVRVFRADSTTWTVEADGVLEGGEVLPGFAVPLAALFG